MSSKDAPKPKPPALVGGAPPRVLIIQAPYYADIVAGLREWATAILRDAGAPFDVMDVAGAFELAPAIRLIVGQDRHGYAGYVALGCVIRGETDHYDFICAAAMQGLMQVSLDHGLALGAGLLTVDSLAQAWARAGADGHNKGAEAAVACLKQINVARRHAVGLHGG